MSSNSKDAYKDLVRAVDNWHVEIFNYFDKRLTNAYTESINSIIRQVERMGRCYSFDALRAKILFNEKLHKKRKPRFNSSAFNKALELNRCLRFLWSFSLKRISSIKSVSHDLIQVLSIKLCYTILSIGMK